MKGSLWKKGKYPLSRILLRNKLRKLKRLRVRIRGFRLRIIRGSLSITSRPYSIVGFVPGNRLTRGNYR